MNHFFIPDLALSKGSYHTQDKELLHQLLKVLRFRAGDSVHLLDGQGGLAEAHLEVLHKNEALFQWTNFDTQEPPLMQAHAFLAVSKKPATFELMIQKAVELGMSEITPLFCDFSQVPFLKKQDRLHLIMKEALEQCEGRYFPTLHEAVHLKDFLEAHSFSPDQDFFLEPREPKAMLRDTPLPSKFRFFLGPEGGFSPQERALAEEKGLLTLGLGSRILRMETACIAMMSYAMIRSKI